MKRLPLNSLLVVMAIAACESSGSSRRVPFYGTPELSDFGESNYIVNAIEEKAAITDAQEVARLTNNLSNRDICTHTLTSEQLYNPYKHLSLRSENWKLEKDIADVAYKIVPTRFSHIKVDYWSKTNAQGNAQITRLSAECFAPSAWKSRSVRIDLGVHPFLKKYSDCLRGGLPDLQAIDDCQDGYESIGGLVHRVKGTEVNKQRYRASWWLKKPANFEYENSKIKEYLRIPSRIPMEFDSIFSEFTENNAYRVKALAFAEETASDLPTYWLIADDQGQNREYLPLTEPEVTENEARGKIRQIIRAPHVANFTGHYSWDRILRVQRRSSLSPVSRFFDDHVHGLFKKLRAGTTRLKVYIVFKAQDVDDVYLEEFLLDNEGNLNFKSVKQLYAYGMNTLGLPDSTQNLDANGLVIYHD